MHTLDSRHVLPVAPNVLARQFNPEALNRAWFGDINYERMRSGFSKNDPSASFGVTDTNGGNSIKSS